VSNFNCGTGLFFDLLFCIFELWLAEGSPPSLLLTQGPVASVAGLLILNRIVNEILFL
jgi:hypothetical protein